MFIFPRQPCGQLRKGLAEMRAIIIGLDAGLAPHHKNLKDGEMYEAVICKLERAFYKSINMTSEKKETTPMHPWPAASLTVHTSVIGRPVSSFTFYAHAST